MISADVVLRAASARPAPTCRATTGITTPASTPPATISNNTFGRLLAALYASPRQVSPTVLEKTSDRPKPTTPRGQGQPGDAEGDRAETGPHTPRLSSVLGRLPAGRECDVPAGPAPAVAAGYARSRR